MITDEVYLPYSCIGEGVYVLVLCVSLVQLFRARHGSTVRKKVAFSMVALVSAVRVAQFACYINQTYSSLPDLLRHMMFVVPIPLQFTTYTILIMFWHDVSNAVKTEAVGETSSAPQTFRHVAAIANVIFWVVCLISIIVYAVYDHINDEEARFHVLFATNLIVSVMNLFACVGFVIYGSHLLLVTRKLHRLSQTTKAHPRTGVHWAFTLWKVTLLLCVCTFCFVTYNSLLLQEAITIFLPAIMPWTPSPSALPGTPSPTPAVFTDSIERLYLYLTVEACPLVSLLLVMSVQGKRASLSHSYSAVPTSVR